MLRTADYWTFIPKWDTHRYPISPRLGEHHEEGPEGMEEPEEGKDGCEMLFSGCALAGSPMNSAQLWLPSQRDQSTLRQTASTAPSG